MAAARRWAPSCATSVTDAQAADLLVGRWYANVRIAKNPGGEIRGQVTRE
jgi:hypothetical protein